MLRSITARACAALSVLFLAACGGGGGSGDSTSRELDTGNDGPSTPSAGNVPHPSCDGYPQTQTLNFNQVTVCEERDYPGLPAGNVLAETSSGDLVAVGG